MLLEQGTESWIEFRRKGIGASDAVIISNMSPWRTRQELWAEKLGLIEPQSVNSSMQRGIDMEPYARKCFENMTAIAVAQDIKIHPVYPFIFASLDGISIDESIIVEIKCTSKKNHALASKGQIPEYYKPQLQHQMSVCGLNSCLYFSYDGFSGIIVPYHRDDEYIDRLIEMEKEFYECMITRTEPQ